MRTIRESSKDQVEPVILKQHGCWDDNIYKTVCIYVGFLCLGAAASVLGPTLVQLQELFQTDTQTMAWIFTCFYIGYILGALLCGLIYDRVNPELLFMLSTMLAGVGLAIGPFVGGIYGFMMCIWTVGLFFGLLDSAGQPYILTIWDGYKKKEPMLQGLHSVWSAGATVGPLVVSSFLVDLRLANHIYIACSRKTPSNSTNEEDVLYDTTMSDLNVTSTSPILSTPMSVLNSTFLNSTTVSPADDNITMATNVALAPHLAFVRWAYITIGCVVLVPSIMFLIAFIINRPYIARLAIPKRSESEDGYTTPVSSSKKYSFIMMVFMFIFYFTFSIVEMTPGNFLSSFAVKELCWENKQGALLISILWGSHGIGRIGGVFLSIFFSPRTMLIGDLALQLLAYVLMLFSRHHHLIMWISTALAGLGMATVMGSGFLWVADHLQITGRVSSVFFVASSLGSTLNPIIVGYLFDKHSPMWVIYSGLIASVVMVFDFVAVNVFTHYVGVRDKRSRAANKPSEMELLRLHSGNKSR